MAAPTPYTIAVPQADVDDMRRRVASTRWAATIPGDGWKYGVHRFGPATYRSLSPGGGGFGDPRTRDPDRVLRDVRDGIVSVASAERDYGVAIAADGRSIDAERTARLRA